MISLIRTICHGLQTACEEGVEESETLDDTRILRAISFSYSTVVHFCIGFTSFAKLFLLLVLGTQTPKP